MKTWVKLYTKANHDPELGSLTWAQRGIWWALLALAGELDLRNGDGSESGELDSLENVAWRIRCEEGELRDAVDAFVARGWMTDEPILALVNFPRLQAPSPSHTREANRERQAEWRARNKGVTSASPAVTPSDSDSDTDTDTDSDKTQTQTQSGGRLKLSTGLSTEYNHSAAPNARPPPDPDVLSDSNPDSDSSDAELELKAIAAREEKEGPLPPLERAQMRSWFKQYGAQKVYDATQIVRHRKPINPGAYMRAVLGRDPPQGG